MNAIELPLGEWLPDQADYKNPGLTEAENVYPLEGGYGPMESPNPTTQTVAGAVIGAKLFYRNNGTQLVVGGTETRLFTIAGGVVSTSSALTATTSWRFERFNDLIIAVSPNNVPQYLSDLDTVTLWAALPGSPPKAAVVGKVSDFLVLGNLENFPNRVQWGAFNNPTLSWTTDPAQLSGFIDLDPKYGNVTGIVGGRWGLVFQERAIWRMVFVGAPKAFDFELVTDERGCVAPDSIVPLGYQTHFMDRDGLYVTNGSEVLGVGNDRVNRWLEGAIDASRRAETHGALNWPKRCIVWTFRTPGVIDYRRQLVYSFVTSRFSAGSQPVYWLVQSNQDALSLEGLDDLGTTLEAFPVETLGNPAWRARDRLFAAFVPSGSDSVFAPMTGPSEAAFFTTGDFSPRPGRRSAVSGLSPIVEYLAGPMTLQTLSRPTQGATYAVSAEVERGADGYAPMNVDEWFHAFRLKMGSGAIWDRATALWVRFKETGKR